MAIAILNARQGAARLILAAVAVEFIAEELLQLVPVLNQGAPAGA